MCGIFGIVYNNASTVPDEAKLRETSRLLHHRGPDNSGVYKDNGIGFVHARLSLLDLDSRSNQPFWDGTKRYCIVYNGEIYNFKTIRTELEQQGVEFKTTSDTEVVLYSIIHWGLERTLKEIEGMYAFAFYDKRKKLTYLVRDKLGIKPLFLYENEDKLMFSSEILAMRPWIQFEPDLLSISAFLLGHAGPTKGRSFFRNIRILPPGTITTIKNGSIVEHETFFSVTDLWDPELALELKETKTSKLIDKVEELLLNSVEQQLIADAPVGALCSGGLDSSLIMAMAKKFHNNLAIFHANVLGRQSEYEAAYELAQYLKLDLKEARVSDEDFILLFPEIIKHHGHPFNITPHSVPFLKVSKLINSNSVKAVLSGEGADECFLGYGFLVPNLNFAWRKPIRSLINLSKVLRDDGINHKYLMGFSPYSSIIADNNSGNHQSLPDLVLGLLNRFEVTSETEKIKSHLKDTADQIPDYGDYEKSLDLLNYNLRSLLHRNDVMGMAASVESRFPFLNSALVKLGVNISIDKKIVLGYTGKIKRPSFIDKWVLRKVAERYLPKKMSERPKKAFSVSAYRRMQINPSFFENSFVGEMFNLPNSDINYLYEKSSDDLKIKLMHLEVWAHIFLYNLPMQEIENRLIDNISITAEKVST